MPLSASFWQTLSSLRLNFVWVQPSRRAASADVGISHAPEPVRFSIGSARARIACSCDWVKVVGAIVVLPRAGSTTCGVDSKMSVAVVSSSS